MNKNKITRDIIRVPIENNELLEQVLTRINLNEEIITLWKVINVNAVDRLGITDHGPVHFQIVANSALRIKRLLVKAGIEMSVTKNFDLSNDYAEVIVFLASLLHDLGLSINRENHEEYSLFLTNTLLREMLDFMPIQERVIVIAETLHAIISHRWEGKPITVEAGIVRVADALDLTKGRSRIPFELEKIDIHSVSANAIDNVEIGEGTEKPVQITISMNNNAGIFQVDELLKRKLFNSGIEKYIEVKAYILQNDEKKLVKEFSVK